MVAKLTAVQLAAVKSVNFINGKIPAPRGQITSVMGLTYGQVFDIQQAAGVKKEWHNRIV